MAIIPIYHVYQRRKSLEQNNSGEEYALEREGYEDYYPRWGFDETDGPTFLPQQHPLSYYDIYGGTWNENTKAALTLTPDLSWGNVVEPPEALRELVRWAISVPGESITPSVALELLATAAISIGVCPDGMKSWNQDVQYKYLISRTCDRLADIFQHADPSAVPEHAVNVFLLVGRFERFDEVEISVFGEDNRYILAEELEKIVRCLKSRSASLLVR